MRQNTYDMNSSDYLKNYQLIQGKEKQKIRGEKINEFKETFQMNNVESLNNTNQSILDKSNISNQIKTKKAIPVYNKIQKDNNLQMNSNRKSNRIESSYQIDEQNQKSKESYLDTSNNINLDINRITFNNYKYNKKKDSNDIIEKNMKMYIDEQTEKIKEFIHEEINNLHMDLIRQFEIQNSQNLKMFNNFSLANNKLYQEIEKLKEENTILKSKLNQ